MTQYAETTPIRRNTPDLPFRQQAVGKDGNPVDLTFATLMEMVFRHPTYPAIADVVETATVSTKTGQTDPTLGWLEFKDGDPATKTTADGEWRYWVRVTIGTDGPYPSDPLTYCVAAEGVDT